MNKSTSAFFKVWLLTKDLINNLTNLFQSVHEFFSDHLLEITPHNRAFNPIAGWQG
jgi:hypothetical protein